MEWYIGLRKWSTQYSKTSIFPKLISRLNTVPIKISVSLFCRYRESYSKMYMELQTRIAKNNFDKELNVWRGNTLLDVKTYYITIVTKTPSTGRQIDTKIMNEKWEPRSRSMKYIQLILGEGTNQFNGGIIVFSTNYTGELEIYRQNMKFNLNFILDTKIH